MDINCTLLDMIALKSLRELQEKFYAATGFPNSFLDNQGNMLSHAGPSNSVCMSLIRQSKLGLERCQENQIIRQKDVGEDAKVRLYQCHAGILDASMPLVLDGRLLGYGVVGQVLGKPPDRARANSYALELGLDPDEYWDKYRQLLVVSRDALVAAADLLCLMAQSLLSSTAQSMNLRKDLARCREAEEAVSKGDQVLRQLTENIEEVFWLGSLDWKKIYYVSPAYERIWGRSCQSLYEVPLSWLDSVDPRDRAMVEATFKNQKGLGLLPVIKFPEYRIIHSDGSVRWIYSKAFPIKDQHGGQYRVAGVARDITEKKLSRQVLAESEAKYKSLFKHIKSGIAVYRPVNDGEDFIFTDYNNSAEKLDGVERDYLLGKSILEVFPGVKEFGLYDVLKEVYKTGRSKHHPVRSYNDEKLFAWRENYVYKLPSGEIVAVYDDFTEIKMAEEALKESESRFRQLFDKAADAIYISDLDGSIIDVNPKGYERLGYSRDEILKLKMKEIDLCYSREELDEIWNNMKENKTVVVEGVHKRKDGTTFPVEINVTCIVRDQKEYVFGMVRDISKRVEAANRIKRERELFSSLAEKSPLGISLINADGEYIYINKSFSDILGYELEDIPSVEEWSKKAYPDSEQNKLVTEIWREDLRNLSSTGVRSRTFKTRCKNGETKLINFRVVGLDNGDQLVIYEDKTEQEKLEKRLRQSQKMEAIGTLAGGIAHDFNNILAAITGYTELALEDASEGKASAHELGQVLKAAIRGRDLVKQILTFSRKAELTQVSLDLNQAVEQAVKMFERLIPKMVDIRLQLSPELGAINGDANQLEQVIVNLASNARDAMPDGGSLLISTQNATIEEDVCIACGGTFKGDYACLTVADNGHGMDGETVRQIFDPFFSTKEVSKGTGLGLSILFGIVKGHGGHVTCQSELGEGTIFNIYFPLVDSAEKNVSDAGGGEPKRAAGDGETILLADDEDFILDVTQKMLTRNGYRVVTAESGEQALDLYQTQGRDIDMVLLDLGMPGMGGHQCLRELLAMDPQAKVIIASGYSHDEPIEDILAVGAAGFLAKPFRKDDLLHTIRQILDGGPGVYAS